MRNQRVTAIVGGAVFGRLCIFAEQTIYDVGSQGVFFHFVDNISLFLSDVDDREMREKRDNVIIGRRSCSDTV